MASSAKLAQQLITLKETLDAKKAKRAELQGELKSLTKQLVTSFGVETIEEAEKQLKESNEKLEALNESIEKQLVKVTAILNADPEEEDLDDDEDDDDE